jgi:hypothetical protein
MEMHPRIEGLIKIGARLIDVMEREIAMLRDMRPGELKGLASDKDTLVAAYEDCMAPLKSDDKLIASASPAIKEELMRIAAKLNVTVAANERALSAAKAANERLLKAVVDAVAADRQRGTGYAKNGGRNISSPRNAKPVSLNIDTRL